jgi:hypothetical protein
MRARFAAWGCGRRAGRVRPRRRAARAAVFCGTSILVVAFSAALACDPAAARVDLTSARSSVAAAAATRTPRGCTVGYDRTYKTDLVERLRKPPELIVLGGSRAQRFEPSVITRLSGLSAFNYALQNARPEDAYAVTRHLYERAPGVRVRCIYAIQSTTFSDIDLSSGLLYDTRLSSSLPRSLRAGQKARQGQARAHSLLSCNSFNSRGCLLSNTYDEREADGRTLDDSLTSYLASLLPRAASTQPVARSRAELYFRKLLALQNAHGVTPLLVIMPYQPTALRAFRAVGWQTKLDRLKHYLDGLHDEYRFRVLDCTEIATFHGSATAFYDGAHIKRENARRLLRYAVRMAPECFR